MPTRNYFHIILAFICAAQLSATPLAQTALLTLEKDLWQASKEELPLLEARITKEIQTHPHSVMGHYLLNQYLIRHYHGDPSQSHLLEQAAQIAFQTMELAPNSELGVIAILDTLDAMGREKEVKSLLNRQNFKFKRSSWRYRLAKIRRSMGRDHNLEASLAELRHIIATDGAQREVVAAYVVSLLKSQKDHPSDINQELQLWQKDHPSPTFLFAIAHQYAEQKKYKKAHHLYQKLYSSKTYKHLGYEDEALLNDGILLTRHLKRHKSAIQLLGKRLRTHEQSLKKLQATTSRSQKAKFQKLILPQHTLSQLHAHLGWAHHHLHHSKSAKKHFLESLKITDDKQNLLIFIQEAHQSKTKDFIQFMSEAIHKIPGHAHLHASLAQAYTKQKKFKTSREFWENAILLQPEQSYFYNSMGLSFYHLEEYEKASLWFQRAIEVDHNDAQAVYNLACILTLTGQSSKAIKALEQAFQLDPSLKAYAPQDDDLKDLHHAEIFQKLISQ